MLSPPVLQRITPRISFLLPSIIFLTPMATKIESPSVYHERERESLHLSD